MFCYILTFLYFIVISTHGYSIAEKSENNNILLSNSSVDNNFEIPSLVKKCLDKNGESIIFNECVDNDMKKSCCNAQKQLHCMKKIMGLGCAKDEIDAINKWKNDFQNDIKAEKYGWCSSNIVDKPDTFVFTCTDYKSFGISNLRKYPYSTLFLTIVSLILII